MRLFLILFAAISLSTAEPLHPEDILSHYIATNAAIKEIFQNLTSTFDSVNKESNKLLHDVYQEVTNLRQRYGARKFLHFRNKYMAKVVEFKDRPGMNHCVENAAHILRINDWQQKGFKDSIFFYLKVWKDEFENLDKIVVETRTNLINLEKKAHDCSQEFDANDDSLIWMCAEKILYKAQMIGTLNPKEITLKLRSLIEKKNEVITNLNKSLMKAEVFQFYDNERTKDDWFAKNCS